MSGTQNRSSPEDGRDIVGVGHVFHLGSMVVVAMRVMSRPPTPPPPAARSLVSVSPACRVIAALRPCTKDIDTEDRNTTYKNAA
jgi:hypothetical protein